MTPAALARRIAIALLAALVIACVLIALAGASPVQALLAMAAGAFGSTQAIGAGLDRSAPYLLAGIGVALCFRAGIINIGAEGQIALGGLGATMAALSFQPSNAAEAITVALLAGALGGAAWAGLAALLHLGRGVHEVLATLLSNFVALLLVQLMLAGPLGEPGAGFLQSPPLPRAARLPLWSSIDAHPSFALGAVLAVAASILLRRTRFGFGLRVLGASRPAARYAGFREKWLVAAAMLIAGALAGLGGAVEVLGQRHRLVEGFSLGFGFRAVTVALLALLHPLATIPAALFVGFLETGAQAMQRQMGVPSALMLMLEAVTVLAVLAAARSER